MHPKEREIREIAAAAPFVPFTFVTTSGERYKVPTPDHISFFPDTDEDGVPMIRIEASFRYMLSGSGAGDKLSVVPVRKFLVERDLLCYTARRVSLG